MAISSWSGRRRGRSSGRSPGQGEGERKAGGRLGREIEEEIGGHVRTAYPTAIFDRPEKRNLTILYRVSLVRQRFRIGNPREIATVEFKARRPTRSSPSAVYFCRLAGALWSGLAVSDGAFCLPL